MVLSPKLAWFFTLEHSTCSRPPANCVISTPENLMFSQGIPLLQWMQAATLNLLVPTTFSHKMSLILKRESSQFF